MPSQSSPARGRPSGCRPSRPHLAAGITALAPVLLAACGLVTVTEPPATPTDFPGLVGRLGTARIGVADVVSGDPGCDDPQLAPTAIRFVARGLDQTEPVQLYLYIFRNRAAFERHRDEIGPCAQSYVTDPDGFEEVEESPYIVAGQGPWAPEFEATLRRVLVAAAGTGG